MKDAELALGAAPSPGPRPVSMLETSANATYLAIRVWTSTRLAVTWKSESPLVYMISDIVSASSGAPADSSTIGLLASFDHPAAAFRATKRIQWAVLEFSQQRPAQCVGVAIVMYQTTDLPSVTRDEAVQEIVALLEQAKPPQILVAANACRQLQGMPGLQLRKSARPSLSAGELERGVQELVWTTPQTYKRVQDMLKQAARKVRPKNEQILASEPTVDLSQQVIAKAQPLPQAQSLPHAQPTLIRTEPPRSESDTVDAWAEFEPGETESQPFGSVLWWSLGAVGALAVLAAIFFLFQPRKKTAIIETPTTVQQAPLPEPAEKAEPAKMEPATSAPQQAAEPVQATPEQSVEDGKTAPTSSPPRRSSPSAPERSSRTLSNQKVSAYEGFSEKDIPVLIRMAESQAGAGNYEDARREYDIVLHLDPGNTVAKQGMRKLNLTEQESK